MDTMMALAEGRYEVVAAWEAPGLWEVRVPAPTATRPHATAAVCLEGYTLHQSAWGAERAVERWAAGRGGEVYRAYRERRKLGEYAAQGLPARG